MTVTKHNGMLKVLLRESEITSYDLDEVIFGSDPIKSKAILSNLLKKALNQTGTRLKSEKIAIEIYPLENGGCAINFILDSRRTKVKLVKRKAPVLLEYNDSTALLNAVEKMFKSNPKLLSDLYEYNGKFRLIIEEPLSLINEGRIINGKYETPKTREYGKLLCQTTAIYTLGSFL